MGYEPGAGAGASSWAPRLPQAALVGSAVGGISGAWMVVLQDASAWAAEVLWTVLTPWLNFPLYALIGAAAGALVGPALELMRRAFASRLSGWTWSAAWLGLGGYAVMTIGYPARAFIAGESFRFSARGLIPRAVVFLILLALALVLLRGHRATGVRQAVADASCLMIATFTVAYLVHVFVLGELARVPAIDFKGWSALAALSVGLAAVFLGVQLGGRRGSGAPAMPGAARLAAMAAVVAIGAVGLWLQRPLRSEPAGRAPQGPNVLLVVLDTLRRDVVSAYGLIEGLTPNLDAFAAQGALWEDAIVPSNWTVPGHASLFTGAQVTRHGADESHRTLRSLPGGPGTHPLPTAAEIFRDRGWRTAAFVSNPNLNRRWAFDRGFAEFYEIWRMRKGQYDALARVVGTRLPFGVFDQGSDATVRGLKAWLDSRDSGRPWFVFVNLMEAHSPYDVPEPWHSRFLDAPLSRAKAFELVYELVHPHKYGGAPPDAAEQVWPLYLGAVAYEDAVIGAILTELADAGEANNTIVVITSDHGENFGWRGLLNHQAALNDDLIRVPLMARGPGIPVGVRDGSPVSLIDVLPTLLHLTGLPPLPPDPGRPGHVLPPIGPPLELNRPRIVERYGFQLVNFANSYPEGDPAWLLEQSAVIDGSWKAVQSEAPYDSQLTSRVDKPRPPQTDGSVGVDDPERLERMLLRLASLRSSWIRAVDSADADSLDLDAETRKELKALGYVE